MPHVDWSVHGHWNTQSPVTIELLCLRRCVSSDITRVRFWSVRPCGFSRRETFRSGVASNRPKQGEESAIHEDSTGTRNRTVLHTTIRSPRIPAVPPIVLSPAVALDAVRDSATRTGLFLGVRSCKRLKFRDLSPGISPFLGLRSRKSTPAAKPQPHYGESRLQRLDLHDLTVGAHGGDLLAAVFGRHVQRDHDRTRRLEAAGGLRVAEQRLLIVGCGL